jgi:hypothetical protein
MAIQIVVSTMWKSEVYEKQGAQAFEDEKECGYQMVYKQKGVQVSEDERMWWLSD